MRNLLLIPTLLILFTACEKVTEIDTELPFNRKVVVACFPAAGDSVFSVSVTQTTPVSGTKTAELPTYISDATVWINQNGNTYPLTYDVIEQLYKGSLPQGEYVDAGETFSVHVQTATEEISGLTTVPAAVQTDLQLTFDSIYSAETNTYAYTARITSRLIDGGTHYIYLYPYLVYADSNRYPMVDYSSDRIKTLTQGETFTEDFSGMFYSPLIPVVRIEVLVITCDKYYARYHNRVRAFDLAASGGLFVEPSILQSNMSNGIGVMGSWNINRTVSFSLQP